MNKETLQYDSLLTGEVSGVAGVKLAASQQVKRGDLLELAVTESVSGSAVVRTLGSAFSRPAAAVKLGNLYAVAAEDCTTQAEDTDKTVTVYLGGYFNPDAMRFGGASTAADNALGLLAGGINLTRTQKA